jgi:hypothetical protein
MEKYRLGPKKGLYAKYWDQVELDIDLAIYQKKPYNPESLKEMKK